MLKQLKYLLNSYEDKELEMLSLWINSSDEVTYFLVDNNAITLITNGTEVKINDVIEQEKETIWRKE